MARDVDDLQRRILDASILLVAEQGVRAVSFREVARRAGVSHQTPYHHFGNHLGILSAIAREGFSNLTASMNAAAAASPDPLQALDAAGVAYVRFARQNVGHFRVMFQSTLVAAPDAETRLPEAEQTYGTLVRLCAAAHRAGAARGLSVEAMSHLAWSTVHGLAMLLIEGTLATKQPELAQSHDDTAILQQVVGGLSRLFRAPNVTPGSAKKPRARR